MVKATLTSSYGYRDPLTGERTYYGPGVDIDIPEGLARTLGLSPSPQPSPEREGEQALPEDFPGRAALVKAGFETVESLLALTFPELIKVKGIGEQTANAILERLEAME